MQTNHPMPTFWYDVTTDAPPVVRDDVRRVVANSDLSEQSAQDLLVAVSEAVTNVVRHSGSSSFSVEVEITIDAVSVSIVDDGAGIGDYDESMPDPEAFGGRGLPLMAVLVDECSVAVGADGGTTVRLRQFVDRS